MRSLLTVFFITLLAFALLGPQLSFAEKPASQKAVLVTGASTGIGRLTTERLAAQGYFVYAGARKDRDLAALNALENVMAVRLDVTVQKDIERAVQLIANENRGLWGLVNNAGVNLIEPLIEADDATYDFIFDVNVKGMFRVTKAFAPLIIESRGRVVNISSISGVLSGGLTGYGLYFMSKHAVEAFTDQLAFELRPLGVSVSAIEPGNYASQIGVSRCKRMLANQREYRYFAEQMAAYLQDCQDVLKGKKSNESEAPDAVVSAIGHALFAKKPKEHYLVVPAKFQAQITVGKAMEELLHLNHDQPYSYSREELIKMMDREAAIVRGELPRGMPGEF